MKRINLFKFLREFPYWKTFKQQMYFIINPVAHIKYAIDEIKKMQKEDNKIVIDTKNNEKRK